jgi:glycosyltransferase involved in cell wall biosynthesis
LAWLKLRGGRFKIFTANHNGFHALFPTEASKKAFTWRKRLLWRLLFTTTGRFISWFTKKCFAVTTDAAEIAWNWYGVQKHKIKVTPLGVDTTQFYPDENRRLKMRSTLGFKENDIVCIHTGKLTDFKNPLLLANAIKVLNEKYKLPFKGLFIGEGEQAAALQEQPYCLLLPYQKHVDLPDYYRAADIAVWHLSVTNSFFDAVASGLPLVCGDDVDTYAAIGTPVEKQLFDAYRPRIVSRFCKTNDLEDLIFQIKSLVCPNNADNFTPSVLQALSEEGLKEIQAYCSWEAIAKERLKDYEDILN